MTRYRNKFLAAAFVTALAATGMGNVTAQELKKVHIAVGSGLINVGYPTEVLPLYLGYYKEAGYDVELIPAGGSLQAIQLMVAGNADFAEVNASPIVQANVLHKIPIRIAMTQTSIDWSIGVLESSPIKEAKDFKGKKIGVFNMAAGMLGLMEKYLESAGVKKDDYELVTIGIGAPAVNAIRSGHVDAVFYWGSGIASFKNALPIRTIYGSDWAQYPDYSLSVMESTIKKDPQKVIGIAKAMAKATAFALENPDCARRVYNKFNNRQLAQGETWDSQNAKDMNIVNAKLAATANGLKIAGGKYGGAANPESYDLLQKFMVSTKEIPSVVPSRQLLADIPDFIAKINDFDVEKIKADARACSAAS